jgi:3-oxoacyl-[acyl-carrier protein] reductase
MRFATIDDVANAALFLSSEEASFLTGNVLEVDGGRCV